MQRSELWGLRFKRRIWCQPNTIPPSLVPFWSRKCLGDLLTDTCYLPLPLAFAVETTILELVVGGKRGFGR